jgi:O-antigen ligase
VAVLFLGWILATTTIYGRISFGLLFATTCALSLLILGSLRGQVPGVFRNALVVLSVVSVLLTAWSFRDPQIGLDGNARYFLGGKNALGMYLLPLVVVLLTAWRPSSKLRRISRWLLVGTAATLVVAGGSGTGLVMVLALCVWLVTGMRLGKRWWLWFATIPVIHWALVSGWLLRSFGWAVQFVEGALGKSSDFTRRSYTWELAWGGVQQNPLGQGRGYSFIGERFSDVSETHNLFLEAFVTGGWPGAVLLLVLIGAVMREAARAGNNAAVYFVWTACLVGTMESYTFHFGFWLLLGLASAQTLATTEDNAQTSKDSYTGARP